jgi:hypothetical protein
VGRTLIISLAVASLLATPGHAMALDYQAELRPGAFVGARLRLPLGKRAEERPLVRLAIAPTLSQISSDGRVQTAFGEGFALNLGRHAKPSLTFAGVPAAEVLGLESRGKTATGEKLGVSGLGWVAIGLGTAAIAGGIYYLILVEQARRNTD